MYKGKWQEFGNVLKTNYLTLYMIQPLSGGKVGVGREIRQKKLVFNNQSDG